ncbi:MAG TPA: Gfo/Idh/MocA family oxidoreductase [Candidatus Limnocylindrales bacterium]|nr:Gfo/Idh/MocA family oxidoreductase [Candidatus Limnocylindrales bacterium]
MTSQPPAGRPADRVRLGVAGLGAVAQAVHLPLIERLRDAYTIDAIADLSPTLTNAVGERYRVDEGRRFGTVEEMLAAPGLDAVAILTSGSHAPAVNAALDAGLPVFVEKPLAFTQQEMDGIDARLATASAPRLDLGYMKLYDPAVMHALEVASERAFGAPRAIEVTVLHPSGESQLDFAHLLPAPADVSQAVRDRLTETTRALQRDALGDAAADAFGRLYTDILLGSVVHELALVRAFAGDPTAVDGSWVWPADAWPPSFEMTGVLPSDGRVSIRWHYLPEYAAYRELVRIVYVRVTIELEFPSPYLLNRPTVLRITSPDGEGRNDEVWTSIDEAFETELIGFHAMVVSGARPAAGAAEGRADIVTCQRAVAALARSRGVEIGGEAAA